jgi:hypothetical protein
MSDVVSKQKIPKKIHSVFLDHSVNWTEEIIQFQYFGGTSELLEILRYYLYAWNNLKTVAYWDTGVLSRYWLLVSDWYIDSFLCPLFHCLVRLWRTGTFAIVQ